MSNDLGEKVQQIAQMLNQEEMPDNVRELVALLTSSLSKKEPASDSSSDKAGEGDSSHQEYSIRDGGMSEDDSLSGGDSSHQKYVKENGSAQKASQDALDSDRSSDLESAINPETINTALKAMDRIKSTNDPRINLLHAIEPFMNARRQQKIGNCIQLLQLSGLSRLLNDREK